MGSALNLGSVEKAGEEEGSSAAMYALTGVPAAPSMELEGGRPKMEGILPGDIPVVSSSSLLEGALSSSGSPCFQERFFSEEMSLPLLWKERCAQKGKVAQKGDHTPGGSKLRCLSKACPGMGG